MLLKNEESKRTPNQIFRLIFYTHQPAPENRNHRRKALVDRRLRLTQLFFGEECVWRAGICKVNKFVGQRCATETAIHISIPLKLILNERVTPVFRGDHNYGQWPGDV